MGKSQGLEPVYVHKFFLLSSTNYYDDQTGGGIVVLRLNLEGQRSHGDKDSGTHNRLMKNFPELILGTVRYVNIIIWVDKVSVFMSAMIIIGAVVQISHIGSPICPY